MTVPIPLNGKLFDVYQFAGEILSHCCIKECKFEFCILSTPGHLNFDGAVEEQKGNLALTLRDIIPCTFVLLEKSSKSKHYSIIRLKTNLYSTKGLAYRGLG